MKIENNKDMYPFLTLRTKTTAQFYFEAKSREDLIEAKNFSLKENIPLFILGGGSNLAIFEKVIKGLVVRNLYQEKKVINETDRYVDLMVSSGYVVNLLVNQTIEAGYSGFEYQSGLPGTVGGAIFMNSKWTRPLTYFGDNLIYANLIAENGMEKKVDKNYFNFAYDSSILQKNKEILLEAVFRLPKSEPAILKQRSKEAFEYRKSTQPIGFATCGCFFRNISNQDKEEAGLSTTSAGHLIDKAGLKGLRVGDFMISDKHANFIVNVGKDKSKPEDLKKLLNIIKTKVKEKFNIKLEEEVVMV